MADSPTNRRHTPCRYRNEASRVSAFSFFSTFTSLLQATGLTLSTYLERIAHTLDYHDPIDLSH
jgi:hypothetical protein